MALPLFLSAGAAHSDDAAWVKVTPELAVKSTILPGRTLEPRCAGAPVPDGAGGFGRSDTEYSFFVKPGNSRKVVFIADGGGACWNAETCIGSVLQPDPVFGPAYTTTVNEFVDEAGRLSTPSDANGNAGPIGGLLDDTNPDNPYADFTKVFLPYCSGDIHWGSKDTTYTLPTPAGGLPWTIHHRGTDNFLSALEYLKRNGRREFGFDLGRAFNVSVTGLSAGGYGAQLIFPYVADMTWPFARLSLISDAAVGVITRDFYAEAIYDANDPEGTSWAVIRNLPPFVRGLDEGLLAQRASIPSSLVPGVFGRLAAYRPFARYSSLTSNLDLVQIAFFALQKGVALDNEQALAATGLEWYLKAALSLNLTAALPNYRFIIENGDFHTFLSTDERVYTPIPDGTGVVLADFVEAQITRGFRGWNSADAGPPAFAP